MHLMENPTLSILGLLILVSIVVMSYYSHHLFLDAVLSSFFILGMAYVHKTLEGSVESRSNKDQKSA